MAVNSIADGATLRPLRPMTTHQEIWCDNHIGSAQQLIEAGVVRPGQFPGDPGVGKCSVTFSPDGMPAQKGQRTADRPGARTIRRVGADRFRVSVRVSEAERQKRDQAWQTRQIALRAASNAHAQAKEEARRSAAEVASFAKTGRQYAESEAHTFWACFTGFFHLHAQQRPSGDGYRFSATQLKEFEQLAQALRRKIADAQPLFDRETRMRTVNEARAKAAKVDMGLQRFLASVVAPSAPQQKAEG